MIILSYPLKDKSVNKWIEKLDDLLLSYKLIEDTTLTTPKLQSGSDIASNVTSIDALLEQIEAEVIEWRKPGCGK